MLRFTRKRRAVAALRLLFGLVLIVLYGAQALASPGASGVERLPDLDQEAPSQLQIVSSRSGDAVSYRLGFRSAVRNVGAGPFVIDGRRTFPASDLVMEADQLVQLAGSSAARRIRGVGELRYVQSTDHQHWHLVGFDRYELRRAGDTNAVVTDRKSGFCLGDRYVATTRRLPAMPLRKVYRSRCGLGQTGLQRIREGISVGYGDDYDPFLEYQDLPLTGLADGRYVLVHRVNADGRLRELSQANNAASVLLDLRWDAGQPVIRILASCPDTDRCDQTRSVSSASDVQIVATGLEVPWDIAWLPDGQALVTERAGRVRLLDRDGTLRAEPVATVPVSARGEGGLLGIAVDPDFAAQPYVYLYYTTATGMKLGRWRWTGSELVPEATLLPAIQAGAVHDSGRIDFGPDARLYVATGDAGKPQLAQSPQSLNGKLLALRPEEYRGTGARAPEVVARGLRNPQGFDWQPGTGVLVANDHGPTGFDGPHGYDEVNVIVPGGNYGWPLAIGSATAKGRFRAPIRVYRQAIAPSGGAFVTTTGSSWAGDYVLAALRGQQLRRLTIRNGRVVAEQALLTGRFGRLRTVRMGPDGALYVLTSNRDGRGRPSGGDDRILRIVPPAR